MRPYGILRFGDATPSLRCDPEARKLDPRPAFCDWRRDRTQLTPGGPPVGERSVCAPGCLSP